MWHTIDTTIQTSYDCNVSKEHMTLKTKIRDSSLIFAVVVALCATILSVQQQRAVSDECYGPAYCYYSTHIDSWHVYKNAFSL